MKVLIIGNGTQGIKRSKILNKKNYFGSLDINNSGDYKHINEVPLNKFDTCFICTPDSQKKKFINFCLSNNKNVLVEKPLVGFNQNEIKNLQTKFNKKNLILYTAYNHRFEPHIKRIKKLINNNYVGKIYSCKIFYGNGTAMNVKQSSWRDRGTGVLNDLAPHLIDLIYYIFNINIKLRLVSKNNFETRASDHVILDSNTDNIYFNLEMSLCSWKNSFKFEIIGENGMILMDSLCKWGPSTLRVMKRVFPSGKPKEKIILEKKSDPTWDEEHLFFKKMVKNKSKTNLDNDIIIYKSLKSIKKNL